jgi:hypothetical protein
MGLVFYGTGFGLDRAAARRGLWPAGDPIVRFTLGCAAWVAALFAAAAVGGFDARLFRALAAAALGLGALGLWRERDRIRTALPRGVPPVALAAALVLLGVLAVVFLLALRPELEWDADVYHLTVPRLYLEHGGFRPLKLNVYSNWPLAVDLLFGLGLLLDDHVTATTLHFGLGLLACAGIYRCVRARAPAWAALAGVAFFLADTLVRYEMTVAYVELGLAFFFLAATTFLLASFDDPAHERGWLLLTGIACGLLASTKHTGAFGVLGVALVYLVHHVCASRAALRPALARGFLWAALPGLALLLPWYAKSYAYTGNPVYPFLWETFGGVDWSEALSQQHAAWHASYGMGPGFLRILALPFVVFSPLAAGYPRFFGTLAPVWTALVPLALFACRGRRAIALPLLAAAVFFAGWAASSQQMRFLVAILPLLAVAGALACARVAEAWPRAQPALSVLVPGSAIALLLAGLGAQPAEAWRSLERYRSQGESALLASAVHPRWRAVARWVSADGRILFVHTNLGFFCERDFVADSFFEASQVSEMLRPYPSAEALAAFLRAEGYTHVLHHPPFRGMVVPPALPALLADPARAVLRYRSPDGYSLYELRGGEG